MAGSVATVLPLPFGWLLAGRAAQGVALGLPALMMGVARDQVPGAKSGSVIAMLSVASTVGVGLGYPLAGLLTDAGGVHAAYGLGLFITVLALLAAWRAIPPSPPGRPGDLDVPGAILLGGGLLALLILVSQSGLWTSAPLAAGLLLAVAAALLAGGPGGRTGPPRRSPTCACSGIRPWPGRTWPCSRAASACTCC